MPTKKSPVFVFETFDQATAGLARYGELERDITLIETQLAENVAQLRKEATLRLAPKLFHLRETALGLEAYAKKVRPALPAGQKTIRLSTGTLGWRNGNPSVAIRGKAEALIARIKTLGGEYAKKYVQTKESLNRPALLRDRPAVEGIRYAQGKERFYVTAQSEVSTAKAVIESN